MLSTNEFAQQSAIVALGALCSSIAELLNIEDPTTVDSYNFTELKEFYKLHHNKIEHDKLIFLIAKIYQSTYDYFVLTVSNIDDESMTAFATGLYTYLEAVGCKELNI